MPAYQRVLRFAAPPITATALAAATLVPAATQADTVSTLASTVPVSSTTDAQQTTTTAARTTTLTRSERAYRIMRNQVGDPYRYGAAGPNAFDCSGLVFFGARAAGFKYIPRTSSAQSGFMRHIRRSSLRAGDFVFFTSGGRVYHVGVWVGPGRVLHSPYSGARVRVDRIWTSSWFAATLRARR